MSKSFNISLADYVPFERVTDEDLLKARIFNKCRMSDTGCWLWQGAIGSGGYGVFNYRQFDQRAHRASYMIFRGEIPAGMKVLHACDTPACVNPAHLRVGTQKENAADREARGRRDVRGEQIGTSKLTKEDILEIRKSTLGNKVLAEKYGIHRHHVWAIRARKTWQHVLDQE